LDAAIEEFIGTRLIRKPPLVYMQDRSRFSWNNGELYFELVGEGWGFPTPYCVLELAKAKVFRRIKRREAGSRNEVRGILIIPPSCNP
jgi:hypothetical protein